MNPYIHPSWPDFWLFPLSHSYRNVWFRYLHRKIPNRAVLHRFLPELFPSPSCIICQHPIDSVDHFLFSCPIKLAVWQRVQREHLGCLADPFTSLDFHLILTTLRFHNLLDRPALMVIAATLESIRISHWSFVFNNVPFTQDTILSIVQNKIRKTQQETHISAGIPHSPPSFSLALL